MPRVSPERASRPALETARQSLGLSADANFEAAIRDYVRENPDAVKLPVTA